VDIVIPAEQRSLVRTDIAIVPPQGTYAQILPRSGLAVKNAIDTKASVINPDYRGNIVVVLHNSSDVEFKVNIGDRIARLVLYHIVTPPIQQMDELSNTPWQDQGFGSTGLSRQPIIRTMQVIAASDPETIPAPFDIWFSPDPFDNHIEVLVAISGDHSMLGFQLQPCKSGQGLQLVDSATSTPAAKIPRWHSSLHKGFLLTFNGEAVSTVPELEAAVAHAWQLKLLKVSVGFAIDKAVGIHPTEGIPVIYWDK
jgi:dUTP pyrophosphatase